jgi:hypothetical protein
MDSYAGIMFRMRFFDKFDVDMKNYPRKDRLTERVKRSIESVGRTDMRRTIQYLNNVCTFEDLIKSAEESVAAENKGFAVDRKFKRVIADSVLDNKARTLMDKNFWFGITTELKEEYPEIPSYIIGEAAKAVRERTAGTMLNATYSVMHYGSDSPRSESMRAIMYLVTQSPNLVELLYEKCEKHADPVDILRYLRACFEGDLHVLKNLDKAAAEINVFVAKTKNSGCTCGMCVH